MKELKTPCLRVWIIGRDGSYLQRAYLWKRKKAPIWPLGVRQAECNVNKNNGLNKWMYSESKIALFYDHRVKSYVVEKGRRYENE